MKPAAPRSRGRLRVVLLAAIVAVLAGTFFMRRELTRRRDAAAAARDAPEARAARAMEEAERALAHDGVVTAQQALREAAAALDEALAASDEVRLQRVRLVVTDRLGELAVRTGQTNEAFDLRKEADRRSSEVLAVDPADEGARVNRLAAAQKLADAWAGRGRVEEARATLVAAAEAVEATPAPTPAVRSALARARLRAAGLDEGPPQRALAAFAAGIAHGEAALATATDPVTARVELAGGLAEAADRAAAAKDPRARDWDARAVELLEAALRDRPDPRVERTLAARHVVAADRAGDEAAARAGYERALALRRARLERAVDDFDARRDLVLALNHLGAFHSARDRDALALAAYAEAAAVARDLRPPAPLDAAGYEAWRIRLVALGNQALLLGRLDRLAEARAAAADAWQLAEAAAPERGDDPQAALDHATAGLRYARLLRAPPAPDRAAARRVARAAQARVAASRAIKSIEKSSEIESGLRDLLAELGGP